MSCTRHHSIAGAVPIDGLWASAASTVNTHTDSHTHTHLGVTLGVSPGMVLRGRGGGGQSPACPDPSQQGQWRCGSSPGASIYTSQGQGGGARGKSEWQPWSPRTRGPGPTPAGGWTESCPRPFGKLLTSSRPRGEGESKVSRARSHSPPLQRCFLVPDLWCGHLVLSGREEKAPLPQRGW